MSKRIYFFTVAFLLVSFLLQLTYFLPRLNTSKEVKMTDFASYFVGAELFRTNRAKLYDVEAQKNLYVSTTEISIADYNALTEGKYETQIASGLVTEYFLPFKSIPLLAYFFSIFAVYGYSLTYYGFFLLNLVFLGLFVICIHKLLVVSLSRRSIFLTVLSLGSFFPVWLSLALGQPTIFLMLLLTFLLLYLKNGQDFLAGLLVGIFFIKSQYYMLFPILIMFSNRKQVFFSSAFLSTVIFFMLNSLLFGSISFLPVYFNFLMHTEGVSYFSSLSHMFSLSAFFANALGYVENNVWILFANSVFYTSYLLFGYWMLRQYSYADSSIKSQFRFHLFLVGGLFFFLHVYVQDFVLGLLVVVPLILDLNPAKVFEKFSSNSSYILLSLFYVTSFIAWKLPTLSSFFFLILILYIVIFLVKSSYEGHQKNSSI